MPDIYVEVGPMDSKLKEIDLAKAKAIMAREAKTALATVRTVSATDGKTMKKRLRFSATLTELTLTGRNLTLTMSGNFSVLPKDDLIKGATVMTTAKIPDGTNADIPALIAGAMADVMKKATPGLLTKP